MRNALAGIERSLFWTLAFAAFAAAAAGFGARAADRMAVGYETQRGGYAIVRVIAPEGPAGISAAEAALTGSSHVTSAAPMTAGRAADLLAQWGGSPVSAAQMPDLRLIEIELTPEASRMDVSGEINATLAEGGVTAEVVRAPESAGGGGLAGFVRNAALWGALAFGGVMAVIVALAARSLAARRREYIAVLADLGATRTHAAGQVADEAAIIGLYAGAVGAVLAAAAAVIVLLILIPDATIETLPDMLMPIDLAPLVAAPLGAGLAAGFGARAAAGMFHAKAARLA
ncbi:cell division protein FtsX [alpha proteobacterium U9-1i]|nr:cell division protein FtsX [alpha proteobacterium U9-1i]